MLSPVAGVVVLDKPQTICLTDTLDAMPEGDSLHRAARRLQVLVGERLEVETPNPRASAKGLVERLDGRVLESVEAVGKNLFLRFEGRVTLRSHLRMSGRWWVRRRGGTVFGRPWLVLRGAEWEALQWNGPVLELSSGLRPRLGPDVLAPEPDFDGMLVNLRGEDQSRAVGDALLDQRLVAGIGNVWKAESLWATRVSPWRALREVDDVELRGVLEEAATVMRASLESGRSVKRVAGRAGRPCPRCGTPIASRGQGDDARIAYWCPRCQVGPEPRGGSSSGA
jgi:endonuclease VIII